MPGKNLMAQELQRIKDKHVITIEECSARSGVPSGTIARYLSSFRQKPVPTDVLHISYGSGDRDTDEIRQQLHDLIDEMADEDLRLLQDITLRMKRREEWVKRNV